ncbi:MAG: leucyl aminopeptidase [Desulfovibrio sp.]|nr:leucyl aminopeptidase [Desulfovibrio sp.]
MDIRFQNLGPDQWKGDILLAPACQGDVLPSCCPQLDKAAPWLAVAPALRDFTGKKEELLLLHGHPELPIPRVLAVGLGRRETVDCNIVRNAIANAVRFCHKRGYVSLVLPEALLTPLPGGKERLLEECICAAQLALYRFTKLKKPDPDDTPDPQWLAVAFDRPETSSAGQAAARRGETAAKAVILARDFAAMPPNFLSPAFLAERASELAQEKGLACTVLDEEGLRSEGMGCLLAVGKGSSRPPRLIVLEHVPAGCEQAPPLILVGKGITFDSGGICLKPAANMYQMKADMTGAAVVLATLAALAEEHISHRVVGLLACADNMPSGAAMRPGDVVCAANGDNVEIQNTDAEGRLALCDALTYAQNHWTPAAIVDIATLTGACAVALGSQLAGIFCDDAALTDQIRASGGVSGEEYWPLPLWKPYNESLKSEVADICHTGPREGGAINAALFLQHFVQKGVRWAHLDIAGVDWAAKATPLTPVGPTAFGVRTLLNLARGGVQ